MSVFPQIAQHLRAVINGGNWTASNLKDQLKDLTWQQATTQVHSFNTIATLTFHTGYYVTAVMKVLQGHPLDAKDSLSFDHPPIASQEDWEALKEKTFTEAEAFATLIEQIPEERSEAPLADPKYGSYYRNLHGIIEHFHYHLGQIALIRKLVMEQDSA